MHAYRIDKTKGKLPVQFRDDRGIWRDFDSLLPDESASCTQVIEHATSIDRESKRNRFPGSVMVLGLDISHQARRWSSGAWNALLCLRRWQEIASSGRKSGNFSPMQKKLKNPSGGLSFLRTRSSEPGDREHLTARDIKRICGTDAGELPGTGPPWNPAFTKSCANTLSTGIPRIFAASG